MEFFGTDIYLPVDRHTFDVTTEMPRHPTAFEWVAARIVADFGASPQFAAASVGDVFRAALGGAGAEAFLGTALDELFSSTVHVLETDERDVDPLVLPISRIRVTEEGRRLLETGLLPSEPKSERREVTYDPISKKILTGKLRDAETPEPGKMVELGAAAAQPPVDLVQANAERGLKEGCRVGRVTPVGLPRRSWRRQRVFFTLDGGKVKLSGDRGGLTPETADYLTALSPERSKALFFDTAFDHDEGFPQHVSELPEDVTRVLTPSAAAGESPRSSTVVLKGGGATLPGGIAAVLEVVPGEKVELTGEPGGLLRLTVPAANCPIPEGGICNREMMRVPCRIRCFYEGLPLELPVVYERRVDDEAKRKMTDGLLQAVSSLPTADGGKLAFLLAGNHEQRRQAVAQLMAATSGEERVSALSALLMDVHARDGYMDFHAIVDGVFGMPGLAGFKDVEEAEALLKALPLSPDEIRWAKGYLARYHKEQAAVGETPENEFVWVESSSKGRSRKGKSRGKRHR